MLIDICTNSDGENFFVGMDGDGDESLHCAGMAEHGQWGWIVQRSVGMGMNLSLFSSLE